MKSFSEVTFIKYFSGKFERIRAKFLRTPKSFLLLHLYGHKQYPSY